MQIGKLSDQIHQLESLVVAVMNKSGNPADSKASTKEDTKNSIAQSIKQQPSQWHNGYTFKSSDDLLDYARAEDHDYEPPVRKVPNSVWKDLLGDELLQNEIDEFLEDLEDQGF
jgi:hypothetical protein